MKKILFRLTTVGEDIYISFYDTSTTGHKRNFEIDIPERTGFHIFTDEEYKLFSEFDLIPDVIDTVLAVGEFDNPPFLLLDVITSGLLHISRKRTANGLAISH